MVGFLFQAKAGTETEEKNMWRLGVIVKSMLFGVFLGPFIGMMFVSYEAESFSWKAFKAEFAANFKLAVVLATLGVAIGLIVGIVKIIKGEHEVHL